MTANTTRHLLGILVAGMLVSGVASADYSTPSATRDTSSAGDMKMDATPATPTDSTAHPSGSMHDKSDMKSGDMSDASAKRDTAATSGDAAITAKVKAALGADQRLAANQIDVKTSKGVVSLGGSVKTAEQKQLAEQLTSHVAGVVKVENMIEAR